MQRKEFALLNAQKTARLAALLIDTTTRTPVKAATDLGVSRMALLWVIVHMGRDE